MIAVEWEISDDGCPDNASHSAHPATAFCYVTMGAASDSWRHLVEGMPEEVAPDAPRITDWGACLLCSRSQRIFRGKAGWTWMCSRI
jgi:hypothetical protein